MLAVVIAIVAVKNYREEQSRTVYSARAPQVLLVAQPADADSIAACGQIIRAVRAAARRGIAVQEISPYSSSELLRRYQVLTTPTVLVLEADGTVHQRFEGEAPATLSGVLAALDGLHP